MNICSIMYKYIFLQFDQSFSCLCLFLGFILTKVLLERHPALKQTIENSRRFVKSLSTEKCDTINHFGGGKEGEREGGGGAFLFKLTENDANVTKNKIQQKMA